MKTTTYKNKIFTLVFMMLMYVGLQSQPLYNITEVYPIHLDLPSTGGVVPVIFMAPGGVSQYELEGFLNFHSGNWNGDLNFMISFFDYTMGEFVVFADVNPTPNSRFHVLDFGTVQFFITQAPGASAPPLQAFNVSGGGQIISGAGLSIKLDNSEVDVTYRLKKSSTIIATHEGTGNAIFFDNIIDLGTYQIEAYRHPATLMMNGTATISNSTQTSSLNLSSNENYITSYTLKEATTEQSNAKLMVDIAYFDGLGRPSQQTGVNASPTLKDIIQPFAYDGLGREARNYLPFTKTTANNGAFIPNAVSVSNYTAQYGSSEDDFAFAEKEFDYSPLNRIMEQGAPGLAWKIVKSSGVSTRTGNTIRLDYKTNTSVEVAKWSCSAAGNCTRSGNYAAGELYITETKDENGKLSWEYKNKQGQLILKKVQLTTSVYAETYYVYDDFGLLRYVFPPEAVNVIGSATSLLPTSTVVKNLCYYYKYDNKKRMIEKQLPGAEPVYMIYNKADRMILNQDGRQRESGGTEWLFTKYDVFGRVVMTGKIDIAGTRDAIQTTVNNESTLCESRNATSSTHYYTAVAYPRSNSGSNYEPLTVNYYDSYGFEATMPYSNVYGISQSNETKAMLTGGKVKVLNTPTWLTSINYYDDKGRVIQTRRQLYDGSNGGVETLSLKLNFTGLILQQKQSQRFNSNTTTVEQWNTYDHMQRLTKTEQEINGANRTTIVQLAYNELGQLKQKTLAGIETMDYTYNIRGWLSQMNNPDNMGSNLFALKLLYNDAAAIGPLASSGQFNGNISGMIWNEKEISSGSYVKKAFGYSYDALNRLTSSDYGEGSNFNSNENRYNEYDIIYDLNGNIRNLKRNSGSLIDNLAYTYENSNTSNRLAKVDDSSNKGIGFIDVTTTDYSYDDNGNLKKDLNKGISNIAYNFLNLPQTITKSGSSLTYYYTATGEKVCKKVGSTNRYYAGGFEYDHNKNLVLIHHPEGVVEKSGSTFNYEYFIKDHLGNTRIAFRPNGGSKTLTQRIVYYPFGHTAEQENSNSNQYKYNGKELQEELNWYDYGARFYDPVVARWHAVDPLAESYYNYSSYNYVLNNPMIFIDPDGRWVRGAGFWNNLTKSDERIHAERRVQQLNAEISDDEIPFTVVEHNGQIGVGRTSWSRDDNGTDWRFDDTKSAYTIFTPIGDNNEVGETISYTQTMFDGPAPGTINKSAIIEETLIGGALAKPLTFLGGRLISGITGRFSANAVSKGANVVYKGFDKAGVVRYVGITERQAAVRFGEHLSSGTAKSFLRYEVVPGATNLSRTGARIWEQTLINKYGLQKNGGLLLNRINSISPKYWWQYGIK